MESGPIELARVLTVRVDLAALPWDADSKRFGQGEAATVLKMLEGARRDGSVFHFFVTTEVMVAFPALVEAVLAERHGLDWLGDGEREGWEEARRMALGFEHRFEGWGLRGKGEDSFGGREYWALDEGFADGKVSDWYRAVEKGVEGFGRGRAVWRVRPLVLGYGDPALRRFQGVLQSTREKGFVMRTLREPV